MSQMRKSVVTGEWVIFASNRHKKPYAYKHSKAASEICTQKCPFCVGNESMTPPERYRTEKDGQWQVRVFKNMYPAVDDMVYENSGDSFYESKDGIGFHEVLVDTPIHGQEPHMFTIQKMYEVLCAIKNRVETISAMDEIEYVQIFKNNGPMAGASIAHSHWQMIGVPLVPMEQSRALKAFEKYREEKHKCLLCDMLEHEKAEKIRMIYENEEFAAFIPYAAKFSYEIWVVPQKHTVSFTKMSTQQYYGLAEALKEIITAVKLIKEDVCYNICFQDAPKNCAEEDYHWYLRIIPRIGALAGFENGTSCYINPMLPEDSAEKMRVIMDGLNKNRQSEDKY